MKAMQVDQEMNESKVHYLQGYTFTNPVSQKSHTVDTIEPYGDKQMVYTTDGKKFFMDFLEEMGVNFPAKGEWKRKKKKVARLPRIPYPIPAMTIKKYNGMLFDLVGDSEDEYDFGDLVDFAHNLYYDDRVRQYVGRKYRVTTRDEIVLRIARDLEKFL